MHPEIVLAIEKQRSHRSVVSNRFVNECGACSKLKAKYSPRGVVAKVERVSCHGQPKRLGQIRIRKDARVTRSIVDRISCSVEDQNPRRRRIGDKDLGLPLDRAYRDVYWLMN